MSRLSIDAVDVVLEVCSFGPCFSEIKSLYSIGHAFNVFELYIVVVYASRG